MRVCCCLDTTSIYDSSRWTKASWGWSICLLPVHILGSLANRIKAIWLVNHAAKEGAHCFKIMKAWHAQAQVLPLTNQEFNTITTRLTFNQCVELLQTENGSPDLNIRVLLYLHNRHLRIDCFNAIKTWYTQVDILGLDTKGFEKIAERLKNDQCLDLLKMENGPIDLKARLLLYLDDHRRDEWNRYLTRVAYQGTIIEAHDKLYEFNFLNREADRKRITELQASTSIVYRRVKELLLARYADIKGIFLCTLRECDRSFFDQSFTPYIFTKALNLLTDDEICRFSNDQIYEILSIYRNRGINFKDHKLFQGIFRDLLSRVNSGKLTTANQDNFKKLFLPRLDQRGNKILWGVGIDSFPISREIKALETALGIE